MSDNGVPGTTPDGNLVNSWGLAAGATGPFWVADNGTGVSTLYTGAGAKLGLTVTVGDNPTGIVANSTTGFDLKGGNNAASAFVFDSEAGAISAWNGSLGTTAEVEIDASPQGAVFKGLAISQTSAGPRLYATDFHNRRVDVFDGNWQQVNQPFQFFDPTIPRDYGPLGIQAIGTHVFVTYAKTQPGSDDEAHGPGLGFVDSFDAATGILDGKVAIRGTLNAPFGLAMAPAASAHSVETCSSVTSATAKSTRTSRSSAVVIYRPTESLTTPRDRRSRSTTSGRSSSATAPRPARPARCSSLGAER